MLARRDLVWSSRESYFVSSMDSSTNMDDLLIPPRIIDTGSLVLWMASSEVDLKVLGNFAATINYDDPFLSAMLYRVLGLSVMLSGKLLRARRLRRLDPTRETKSLQLYHHIIWLSREGLLILEQYVLPMVERYVELKVLAYKLRASFYHIFVLFHNQPAIHSPGIVSIPGNVSLQEGDGNAGPKASLKEKGSKSSKPEETSTPRETRETSLPAQSASRHPPGLAPVQPPKPASSFLLPAIDYTTTATACFNHSAALADKLLPGSHPIRLSVKLEYAAYLHDCLHDPGASRRVAKQAIADVYNAQEGMDDESFEDAAEIVRILGKMIKRGERENSAGQSSAVGSDGSINGSGPSPSAKQSEMTAAATPPMLPAKSTVEKKSPVGMSGPATSGSVPAVPSPKMVNPI